ncbi:MAG: electron transport complex subunit RsxC [Bacteroidales bacterium]|nr:electron transport complex subunit RsxC [Bacteroidales bacterium]
MLRTFTKGGIHPAENKITAGSGITVPPLPEVVTIPLLQHIGAPSKLIVDKGDEVRVGQLLARSEGYISANLHSSVSGKIARIDKFIDNSGYKRNSIQIEVTGDDWLETIDQSDTLVKEFGLTQPEIVKKIQESGIVGLGGATFPSHVKLSAPREKKTECLLINGVECEPYLTADHVLMLEKGEEIMVGIRIIMHALQVKKAIIGIEANKQNAIDHLSLLAGHYEGIRVLGLKVKYPQGSEKHLIKAVHNREVPSGGLPIDMGCVVFNVGTVFAVYEAVQKNKPLIERITTVTGNSLKSPANFKVRLGTSIAHLIEAAGGMPEDTGKVISGGPMMGRAINDLNVPVTKGTSGILLLKEEIAHRKPVQNCIRCSKCISVCPMGMEPYLIMAMTVNEKIDMLEDNHIMDCMECGSCSYICPANRPLLDYIRFGKVKVREFKRKNRES